MQDNRFDQTMALPHTHRTGMSALAERLRTRASELGIARLGFSRAGRSRHAAAFEAWLARGYAGQMAYMEVAPASRADVTIRSPWARTIVSAAIYYGPSQDLDGIAGLVSRYARGRDYHTVVREKLEQLAAFLKDEAGGTVEARLLIDTSAVLERDQAAAAGIGWTGKNAMTIDPELGSYVFLGEILTDLEFEPSVEPEDLCGACTRCLDACPTGAIVTPKVVDATRCISYLTIELRGPIPQELRAPIGERLFGCDVCQEVCPWNRREGEPVDPALDTDPALLRTTLADIARMGPADGGVPLRGSAIGRTKREGLVRNAFIVGANLGDERVIDAAHEAVRDESGTVRESAVWALCAGGGDDRKAAEAAADREADPAIASLMRARLDAR